MDIDHLQNAWHTYQFEYTSNINYIKSFSSQFQQFFWWFYNSSHPLAIATLA